MLQVDRVNDYSSDTSIFRQSYYRSEKCTESRFFTENDKTLLWNLQPKNEVAATNDKDMQAQNTQLSEIRGFRRSLSIIRHLPATL